MSVLVLDSGAVSHIAHGREQALEDIQALVDNQLWPPIVPTIVLAESFSGRERNDVPVHRLLNNCAVVEEISRSQAHRAGKLRTEAGCGSAIDAMLVALAEPGGTVLTEDVKDLVPLAQRADRVSVMTVKPRRRSRM
ncbi:PIN domain-containing protein [Candidatus Poriferisodalis sp.]|uniref:PIN domain-containing protein n=1 Tax=Candidatus Poriferisodalis sp. TaxID=3101277 RepID=UPI003B023BBE